MVAERLEVKLLGRPELLWRGHRLEAVPPKLRALLFYLAVQQKAVARSELEELFWNTRLSGNLRQALHQLRALPGAERWLQAEQHVTLHAITDLVIFEAALQNKHYRKALEIWRAVLPPAESRVTLLWGFELDNTPAFNDWLEVERARVEMLYLETLEHHALELEKTGHLSEALGLTEQLLHEDPLNESAYSSAMRLCYRMGQPEVAHSYFKRCRRALLEGLGVEPLEETLALARNLTAPHTSAIRPERPTLRQALEQLPDPRSRQGQRYPLTPLLGLVLLAVLNGARSLREIVRFGYEHPDLLSKLGFQHPTPPGRSTLSELLGHLDLQRLRETLSDTTPLPHNQTSVKPATALGLLQHWALELRYHADSGEIGWLNTLIERLGWSGLLGWVCFGGSDFPGWPRL